MIFMEFQIFSQCLHTELPVWVSLPEREKAGKDGFRTIWLYHGGGGSHMDWLTCTDVQALAEKHEWALVMPTTLDSCFVDMNQGERFGEFVGEELVREMRKLLPCLSKERSHNVVSGFSNGGYGALLAGLRYPENYGWIAAFAAGDKADADFSYRPAEKLRYFGEGNLQESPYSTKHLARELVKRQKAGAFQGELPRVFHAYGELDPWRGMNELVRDDFLSYPGDPYHYQHLVIPGKGHEWSMCQRAMEDFMRLYEEDLQNYVFQCSAT